MSTRKQISLGWFHFTTECIHDQLLVLFSVSVSLIEYGKITESPCTLRVITVLLR